jgi:UDP-N-acetylmuramyl pentapeptide phosphotransferase/UDP-N-acetylglucosamine-1-phosphate transferase
MSEPLLAGVMLAVACAIAVNRLLAVVIPWLRERAVAHPNARSSHAAPTPQGAGIVVIPVVLAGIAAGQVLGLAPPAASSHMLAVAGGTFGLMLVGYRDDRQPLPAAVKFAMQGLAALVLVLTLPSELRVLPGVPIAVERIAAFVAVMWFINLFNFMDGIDWISAVETGAISTGILCLGAFALVPAGLSLPAAILLAAMVGFAPWNAPPARVFLGDAGSLPIGFMLAALLLHVAADGALAAAFILPLYDLGDATVTLVRRLLRKERVWEAHREHFYQRAVRGGYSVRATTGRILLLDIVLIVIAVAVTMIDRPLLTVTGVAAAAGAVALVLSLFAGAHRRAKGHAVTGRPPP